MASSDESLVFSSSAVGDCDSSLIISRGRDDFLPFTTNRFGFSLDADWLSNHERKNVVKKNKTRRNNNTHLKWFE